jgi:hypothetical protein
MEYSSDTVTRAAFINKKKKLHFSNWLRYGELTDSIRNSMWHLFQTTANIRSISSLQKARKMVTLLTEGKLIWLTLLGYENILRQERM